MKTALLFLAILAVSSVQGQTLCEKYGGADQLGLMETLIGDTVTAVLGDPLLLPFFDGSAATGLTNFTDPANAAALQNLFDNLVSYFGSSALLACNEAGFPVYAGNPSMLNVHSKLPITYAAFFAFNAHVVEVADINGVEDADLLAIAKVLATGDTLEGKGTFYEEICNDQKDCQSFCNFYSNALVLKNSDLLTAVVVNTFTNITVDDSPIKKYFDGTETNSRNGNTFEKTDFINDGVEQGLLVSSLNSFFGDALGCSDGTLEPYTGEKDMKLVHSPMNSEADDTLILQNEFDFFNDELIAVLISFGVSADDAKTVRGVLDSFQADICGGCGGDGSTGGASTMIPALFALIPLLAFFF